MNTTSDSTTDAIEIRDLRFDLAGVPKYWHGGRRSVTIYFDNLSVFFPAGERFFISAVKAFQRQVTDPVLAGEVAAFCAQEGHHSREHVRYNRHVESHGFPIAKLERNVEALLRVVCRLIPKKRQLAATCALEHFTSVMGMLVLSDPRMLEGAHPKMEALWTWHAGEENEHKSVSFDLHRHIGGGWLERCTTMLIATVLFWGKVFEHQVRMMHAAGILFSIPEWWALFKFLWIAPGGFTRLVLPYFRYFRRDFHPRELDSAPLLAEWKASLENSREFQRALTTSSAASNAG